MEFTHEIGIRALFLERSLAVRDDQADRNIGRETERLVTASSSVADGEKQQAGNTLDTVDGRMNRLEQEVAQLRKEIAKLQQSDSIAQAALAEMRKTLAVIGQNQAVT